MAADCRRYEHSRYLHITPNDARIRLALWRQIAAATNIRDICTQTRMTHVSALPHGGVDAAAADKRDSSHHTVYRTHSRRRCGRKTIPYDKQNPRCASIAHRGFCFVFAFYQSLPQSVSLLSQLSQSQSLSQSSSRPEP